VGTTSGRLGASGGAEAHDRAVVTTCAFEPVFQPVADLRSREIVGFEALTRFEDGTAPDLRFKEAAEMGVGVQLEEATLGAAIEAAERLTPARFLSVNVSPALILERDTIALVERTGSRPLVLELTERDPVDDYGALARVLEEFGSIELAVDDAGRVRGLRHILALHPSYIKLDITGCAASTTTPPARPSSPASTTSPP
jgi:EAL domain-containing protein (putative c-di-GMP-specific phosphodiesterase class I)